MIESTSYSNINFIQIIIIIKDVFNQKPNPNINGKSSSCDLIFKLKLRKDKT